MTVDESPAMPDNDPGDEEVPSSEAITQPIEMPHDGRRNATNSITTDGKPPAPGFEDRPAPQPLGPDGQHGAYWVLTELERAKGFVRPVRDSYKHLKCGTVTMMGRAIAETFARSPTYYGSTFCVACGDHTPVGADGLFVWMAHGRELAEKVGT